MIPLIDFKMYRYRVYTHEPQACAARLACLVTRLPVHITLELHKLLPMNSSPLLALDGYQIWREATAAHVTDVSEDFAVFDCVF
ncbi:hypothetical protein ANN_13270 [Periplaneta americana]|uniref:Uncharacterized protein n=1 Tax=Periplaneta americana TaxID=6978 RepID=A0ABQ8TJY3_PERAM|nr:hypothetical protein ANN_13270 [Periplaneta americana]